MLKYRVFIPDFGNVVETNTLGVALMCYHKYIKMSKDWRNTFHDRELQVFSGKKQIRVYRPKQPAKQAKAINY